VLAFIITNALYCQVTLICRHPMVCFTYWQTGMPAFVAQIRTWRFRICIVLSSVMSRFGNQKVLRYNWCFQMLSLIEHWTSNSHESKQLSGALIVSSMVMRCSSRGEESVLKVLEIVSKVGRQGKYEYGLGGVFFIQWHHLVCDSARIQFEYHHLSTLISRPKAQIHHKGN